MKKVLSVFSAALVGMAASAIVAFADVADNVMLIEGDPPPELALILIDADEPSTIFALTHDIDALPLGLLDAPEVAALSSSGSLCIDGRSDCLDEPLTASTRMTAQHIVTPDYALSGGDGQLG